MVRYYCEYCHSYLTHDTLSVRNSHLVGKNHIKMVADYYRNKSRPQRWPSAVSATSNTVIEPSTTSATATGKSKLAKSISKIRIHPSTRAAKKVQRQKARAFAKEQMSIQEELDRTLTSLYRRAPGYSKVFIPDNRFDISASVRQARRPQRANERGHQDQHGNNQYNRHQHTDSNMNPPRDETIDEAARATISLPPPRVLTAWANPIPRSTIPQVSQQYASQLDHPYTAAIKASISNIKGYNTNSHVYRG
ncbi:hypothetical protein TBLA_0A09810 [Henningerozyma blattae CBS 6284]|uniref:Matrin-type domain-containing protein n=1 Tax=Henningerozyma blattae (strain ATCC 34711 / CBS 6284 / DSM 70876 / NBRC 10599 / NRRL Y-10934 / UCD 77-7) TaxID=1071380 RepID=I2GXB2_HENB6|nr:hypothetical protein TBLA_0A09810 [Tetrapisispora blattae CBS 6284]CCH58764.1 hypothetical protein TBLA_0A09810 [Tetrapisispora blattae CBS 6284]